MLHPLISFSYCPKCGSDKFYDNDSKSKRCNFCGFTFYLNPSAAVAAFIVNKDGEMLVCRRACEPAKGTLDLPGGFVDINESVEQALVREVLEETSLEVLSMKYLFSLPNNYNYCGFDVPTVDLFYLVTIKDRGILEANDDVDSCEFLPLSEVKSELFGLQSISKGVSIFLNKAEDL
ncbi:MAG: NUDIX domain-containing protein [Bacteroidales bacterium]